MATAATAWILDSRDVRVEKMGRMIDPFLIRERDGRWWCFFKQAGASRSWSRDLRAWTYDGRFPRRENACIVRDGREYVLFHSPSNGIGVKRSLDLRQWHDTGRLLLGRKDWPAVAPPWAATDRRRS